MKFLERMLLRDYAVIERIQPRQTHGSNLQFAALATSAWVFLVAMTAVSLTCLILREHIPSGLNLLSAPMPVAVLEIFLVMTAVGVYVDRIADRYKSERPETVDKFKARDEVTKWWLTTISIFPIVGVDALVLMKFFGRI
jgi:hypothetical protein